jgi:hypothetical protein
VIKRPKGRKRRRNNGGRTYKVVALALAVKRK